MFQSAVDHIWVGNSVAIPWSKFSPPLLDFGLWPHRVAASPWLVWKFPALESLASQAPRRGLGKQEKQVTELGQVIYLAVWNIGPCGLSCQDEEMLSAWAGLVSLLLASVLGRVLSEGGAVPQSGTLESRAHIEPQLQCGVQWVCSLCWKLLRVFKMT